MGRELTFIEYPPTSEHFIFIISYNQDCEIVILLTQKQPSDADVTPFPGLHFPVLPIPAVPLWFLRESPFPHFCLFSDLFQIPNGCWSADVDLWDVLSLVSSSPSTLLLQRNYVSSLVTTSLLGWLPTGTWFLSQPQPHLLMLISSPSSLMGKDGILVLRNKVKS